jgi:C-terminus of AA_permease
VRHARVRTRSAAPAPRRRTARLYLMLNLSIETWLRFLVWLVIGLAVYACDG